MKITINQWPESQGCIGCAHSVFVTSSRDDSDDETVQKEGYDFFGSSAYACRKDNDVEDCEIAAERLGM